MCGLKPAPTLRSKSKGKKQIPRAALRNDKQRQRQEQRQILRSFATLRMTGMAELQTDSFPLVTEIQLPL
jgi:hypothetical protein